MFAFDKYQFDLRHLEAQTVSIMLKRDSCLTNGLLQLLLWSMLAVSCSLVANDACTLSGVTRPYSSSCSISGGETALGKAS